MAISPISPISLTFVIYALLLFLCSLKNGNAVEATKTTKSYYRGVKLKSLLPSDVCNESIKEPKKGPTLKVVHRYGPCTQANGVNKKPSKVPSAVDILFRDELRVNSIRARLAINPSIGVFKGMQTTVPASLSGGGYVVTVGLGTPKKDFTLTFDTGSDLTWTLCEPCLRGCIPQDQPKLDPTKSTSYKNVSCSSEFCNAIAEETGARGCSSSTCLYRITYGSGASIGFLATEALTISSSDVFQNIVIGCSQGNAGNFYGVSGLLGLGRSPISLVSQTADKYQKVFSYCLPSSPSTTGYLSFGGSASQNIKFTPLTTIQDFFYGLDIVGISVAGRQLPIDASIFTEAGTIIDSGTTLTYLPSTAFSALSSAFQQEMTNYTLVSSSTPLKPCYDLSNFANGTITLPKIGVSMKGGLEVDVDVSGILFFVRGLHEACLGFADTGSDSEKGIFGNLQQRTYEVVYDVSKDMLGFSPNGCK